MSPPQQDNNSSSSFCQLRKQKCIDSVFFAYYNVCVETKKESDHQMTKQIDKTQSQADEFVKNTASQIPSDIPKLLEAMSNFMAACAQAQTSEKRKEK
nr:MAG TPA: hypothetical protein [Caudoviricetes sp.]